jgi:hypothetical protein
VPLNFVEDGIESIAQKRRQLRFCPGAAVHGLGYLHVLLQPSHAITTVTRGKVPFEPVHPLAVRDRAVPFARLLPLQQHPPDLDEPQRRDGLVPFRCRQYPLDLRDKGGVVGAVKTRGVHLFNRLERTPPPTRAMTTAGALSFRIHDVKQLTRFRR